MTLDLEPEVPGDTTGGERTLVWLEDICAPWILRHIKAVRTVAEGYFKATTVTGQKNKLNNKALEKIVKVKEKAQLKIKSSPSLTRQ